MIKRLANNVFEDYMVALGPWTRGKWVEFHHRWVVNNLLPIDDKYLQEAVEVEFEPYYDDPDPLKMACDFFLSWINDLNERIAFLQGNRPWHAGLESVGGCFVKKRGSNETDSHESRFGFFRSTKDGVEVMRKDRKIEKFRDVHEMVLVGKWIAD